MAQLKTTFAGLSLSNPIIISSSGLTDSSAKIKKLEEAGAGAVVLKSVFEEQIAMQAGSMQGYGSPEANDYLGAYVRSHALNGHISLIKEAKDACGIPVIASINCYSSNEWVDFAKTLEEAGADALELNILSLQTEKDYEYGSFEQRHIDILKRIKAIVKVPVIMKLGNNLTNPVALINQLYANGADGVVLFNRFYQPDINTDNLSLVCSNVLSSPYELTNRVRWIAIASAKVPRLDYAVSGGVYAGKDIVKAVLAGASVTEVCSAIYRSGNKVIAEMKNELSRWMDEKGYETLEQFRGRVNAQALGEEVEPFERTQFMRYYGGYEE